MRSRSQMLLVLRLLTAWAILAGILIGCGEIVHHSEAVGSADRWVTNWLVSYRSPALDHAMRVATWLGSSFAALVITVVVAVLAAVRRLPLCALAALVGAWLGESSAVNLTKTVVRRPRPPEHIRLVVAHGWSFPSGHTATGVVVFATVASVAVHCLRHQAAQVAAAAACGLVIALVGFSRIELGAHWMSDVIASLLWTTAWLLVGARLTRTAQPRADPDPDGPAGMPATSLGHR